MPAIFISHSSRDAAIAHEMKSALAGMGFDGVFLDFDKDTGIGAGTDWEQRLYEELKRCHAVILVLTPNWLESKWCFAELTRARGDGKVILPVICAPLQRPFALPQVQTVDLIDWQGGGLDRIAQRLHAITDELARGFALDPHRSPYPGINAFEAEDAAIFFGRDEETRSVIERLEARRTQGGAPFIVVIGASGAGKSSLLKAGVLPQLGRRRDGWLVLPPMRPEKAPLEALAKILAEAQGDPGGWRVWHERLTGPNAVREVGELVKDLRVGPSRSATVLLPVDQLEELFTITDPGERNAFLTLLAGLPDRSAALPVMVVATGRADVLQGLLEESPVAALVETMPLLPMPLDRVPRLVTGPAAVASLVVEDGLAAEIAHDVESVEALPLLAQTLRLLYERCAHDKRLTIAAYRALGDAATGLNPIQNSVRLAADQALAALSQDNAELEALRDAFIPHLVRVRLDDGRRVRQPAQIADLPREAGRLIRALTEARLLTSRVVNSVRIVEVTHEALFATWPTLAKWLRDEHAFLVDLERLKIAHDAWVQAPTNRRREALLRGLLLSNARQWLSQYPNRFVGAGMSDLSDYILASSSVEDTQLAKFEKRRRYQDVLYENIHKFLLPELRSKRYKLNEEIQNHKQIFRVDVDLENLKQNLSIINNFIEKQGKWHPDKPIILRTLGAQEDYADVYQFPCCGTIALGDSSLAVPSQFRDDGCENPWGDDPSASNSP